MLGVPGITPAEVQKELDAGRDLLVVCAYENTDRFHMFRKNRLRGAIALDEFRKRLERIDKRTRLVFYCN